MSERSEGKNVMSERIESKSVMSKSSEGESVISLYLLSRFSYPDFFWAW